MSVIEELIKCNDPATFNRDLTAIPGMVKGKAAWGLNCDCGYHDCFMVMFQRVARGVWVEPVDIEVLVSRWEAMIIITFEDFDQITNNWITEYHDIRTYRCAKELIAAYEEGPGRVFNINGEDLFIGPNEPPPGDLLEFMRGVAVRH